ncbi:MAG: lysophospholipid acyltransferase family protein, partial [Patescibacteria group bacterium]|nr:lysophospholipid acyltransferase family protein [Patescibacteria group bacterium]
LLCCSVLFWVFAGCHLYVVTAQTKFRRCSPAERRRRFHAWAAFWLETVLRTFCRLTACRIEFTLPAATSPPPAIVIINHRSAIDLLISYVMLSRSGYRDLRYVAMREIKAIPVAGRFTLETGCCLVKRHNDPDDIGRIRDFAQVAGRDGATVVIFPEGTTYGNPSFLTPTHADYAQVLPPRLGGIKILVRELPEYAVLSLTIDWRGNDGVWLERMTQLVERGLSVEGEYVSDIRERPVEVWLVEEWHRKDAKLLGSLASRQG